MLALLADWGELAAALTLFLASHAIPARPPVRSALIGAVGRSAFFIGYSVVSLVILGWLIAAAGSAPYVELWPREDWQTLVPSAGMLGATILAVFALTTPNPLSLAPRGAKRFDPERPGIAGFVRHPILWATLLWSGTHIVPNGDVSHVVMFGLFALLSVGGMVMLDRRKQRRLGQTEWREMARRTSNWPLVGLARGWRPRPDLGSVIRVAAGVAVYALLMATHGIFAGVPLI